VENLHGVKISDQDLPANLRKPTDEEFTAIYADLKKLDQPLKKIGDYLKLRFKVPEAKTAKDCLTLAQWNDGMKDMKIAFDEKKLAELLEQK